MVIVVEALKLKKTFGKGKKANCVVDGVTLSIREGEVFGFLGPNGAGKTTTLRMLTTLLDPDSGEVTICGHSAIRDTGKIRKIIGYVSQTGGADPSATARENLILQARLYGFSKKEAQRCSGELIEKFQLTQCGQRRVSTFSGGEKRRLDIALGVLHKPKVLFLDEPTLGLDPHSRTALWEVIREIQAEGTTILLTSHYLEEVDMLADRLAIIDKGKIIAEGTPDELKREIAKESLQVQFRGSVDTEYMEALKAHPTVQNIVYEDGEMKIFVDQGQKDIAKILELLDIKKNPIEKLVLSEPTLNDVFLEKTGRNINPEEVGSLS